VRITRSFEEETPVAEKVSWADKLRDVRKRWFGH
jgi:hypothetical protein